MNYLTYGNKENKTLLFIHGMASTALLCYEPILKYLDNYYVVLAEIDGHSNNINGDLEDLSKSCDDIEEYINENFDGHIYGLCGFSMGATMVVELIGRGNILADRVVLDAAFTVKMGIKTKPFEICFTKAIERIQKGKRIPKFLLDYVMGKDNNSIVEMLYQDVTSKTIINACEYVYKYEIPIELKNFKNPVLFLRGSRELFPKKSASMLKKYIPQMEEKTFEKMGHGQYLHEHPSEYVSELIEFFNKSNNKDEKTIKTFEEVHPNSSKIANEKMETVKYLKKQEDVSER